MSTKTLLGFLTLTLMACGEDAAPVAGTTTPAQNEARANGIYEVPVSAELSPSASYATTDIRWTVLDGEARLSYDLPASLVGHAINVDFRGPFDASAGKGTLTGSAGTADCTVVGTSVVCNETMRGLRPIEVDRDAVAASARADAASIADRIAIADQFAADPIGIIRFSLSTDPGSVAARAL